MSHVQAWMPVISELAVEPGCRSLTCRLLVRHDMPVLRGHFPAMPMVPGVVMVGWATELARAHGLATGRFAGIITAKFQRIVRPGMHLEARLEQGARPGQLQFRYEFRDTVVSTGRLQFGAGGD